MSVCLTGEHLARARRLLVGQTIEYAGRFPVGWPGPHQIVDVYALADGRVEVTLRKIGEEATGHVGFMALTSCRLTGGGPVMDLFDPVSLHKEEVPVLVVCENARDAAEMLRAVKGWAHDNDRAAVGQAVESAEAELAGSAADRTHR